MQIRRRISAAYKDIPGGQVLGVAIEHHNLKPGETTNVFVIRRGGER